jgi:hypothetical protein
MRQQRCQQVRAAQITVRQVAVPDGTADRGHACCYSGRCDTVLHAAPDLVRHPSRPLPAQRAMRGLPVRHGPLSGVEREGGVPPTLPKCANSIENMLQARRTSPALRRTMAVSGSRVVASLELLARRLKKQKSTSRARVHRVLCPRRASSERLRGTRADDAK